MVFDVFAATIRPKLVAYAVRKGANGAEDVAQDTLAVLWAKYSHLDEADWVPLAYTICRNKVHEARRRLGTHEEALDHQEPADTSPDPFQALSHKEMRDQLRNAVRRLPERCKHLVRLWLMGHPIREIAQAMNTRPATMHVVKHRCFQTLLRECS